MRKKAEQILDKHLKGSEVRWRGCKEEALDAMIDFKSKKTRSLKSRVTTFILVFSVTFFGTALFYNTPEDILDKSYILFTGVLIATIIKLIDDFER